LHNGRRQETAAFSQPVHHRPLAETGQEKARFKGEKRDEAGETP
jgi:hypothetical protein